MVSNSVIIPLYPNKSAWLVIITRSEATSPFIVMASRLGGVSITIKSYFLQLR